MTLNCFAYNCTYNNNGACYAGNITITGANTSSSVKTHCSNFSKSNGSLSNLTSNYFTTSNDITCKATHCSYNAEYTCTASSVNINASNACCDTFINN